MKLNIFLPLIGAFLLSAASWASRPDSISIHSDVIDNFTKSPIEGALVTFMLPDSVVLFQDSTSRAVTSRYGNFYVTQQGGELRGHKLPGAGRYLARISATGYQEQVFSIEIPAKKYAKWVREWKEQFALNKAAKRPSVELGEARIRATRVKMVMRGDTLVYDADAFRTSEGSMLDRLLAAMPGFKVDESGQITHNGQRVEELLVDGKSFFSGNPKVALENLPAYTVNTVKVYRRAADNAYLLTDSSEIERTKRLVVDVNLKRQYRQGWLANAEAAGGSHDRYLGRAMAMRYTDHSKLFLFYNMNNLNDTHRPNRGGTDGNWYSDWTPSGTLRLKMGGLNFNVDSRKKTFEESAQLIMTDERTRDEQKTSALNYLPEGDTWQRRRSLQESAKNHFKLSNQFTMPHKRFHLRTQQVADVLNERNDGSAQSATFSSDPQDRYLGESLDSVYASPGSQRLERMTINTVRNLSHSHNREWLLESTNNVTFKSPLLGNSTAIILNAKLHNASLDAHQFYDMLTPQTSGRDYRRQFSESPTRDYDWNTQVRYLWNFSRLRKLYFTLTYQYRQTYDRGNRNLFRLDRLAGDSALSLQEWMMLPSQRDEMLTVLDLQNSFHTVTRGRSHQPGLEVSYNIGRYGNLRFNFTQGIEHKTITDLRAQQEHSASRHLHAPDLRIQFFWARMQVGKSQLYNSSYQLTHAMPTMNHLLNVTDNSHPTYIRTGNPALSNSRNHHFSFNTSHGTTRRMRNMNASADWHLTEQAVAMTRSYDRPTGITTYRPRNINGNWNASLRAAYSQTVDSLNRLNLSTNVSANYGNSADFVSESSGLSTASFRSSVRNMNLRQELNAKYTKGKTAVTLFANYRWQRLTSHRPSFTDLSAWTFAYGVNADFTLPRVVTIENRLSLTSRRGYSDAAMNDDRLVWNLTLRRSLIENILTLSLEAYDLLHQLDNVRTSVNSQGLTETWYNTIPNYLLLRLSYRFHAIPKKNGMK
ncbi:MAG: outer membrane beta-barrel protein [Bacteroidaceae bacterium]|nr:outer membrane beta-barrel protein [Bacteroidaceae bacterium]